LPNLFRRIFAEGAFSLAFVPLFTKRLEDGEEAARSFAEEALALLGSVLFILTLLATLVMPILMYLLVAGFADQAEKFDKAVLLGRVMFPYLMLVSLTALFSGVLNALGKFAVAAGAPILLNLFMIPAALMAMASGADVALWLSVGVTLSGIAQLWLVASAARRAGIKMGLRMPKLTGGMRQMLALAAPAVIAGGAMQLNLVIGSVIASFFAGAVSWLAYADRLYQLPLGVVGVAVGVVLMPELSKRVKQGDKAAAQASMTRSIEFALALTIPATMALIVIPTEIARALFERGAFASLDSQQTGTAAALFALGLPAYVLVKVFTPGFFAEEDSKTPLRLSLWTVGVNTVLAIIGAKIFGWLAIPIATAIAAWMNAGLLWRGLSRNGYRIDPALKRKAVGILGASLIMALVLLIAAQVGADVLKEGWFRLPALLAMIIAGMAVYGVCAQLLGGISLRELRGGLKRNHS